MLDALCLILGVAAVLLTIFGLPEAEAEWWESSEYERTSGLYRPRVLRPGDPGEGGDCPRVPGNHATGQLGPSGHQDPENHCNHGP